MNPLLLFVWLVYWNIEQWSCAPPKLSAIDLLRCIWILTVFINSHRWRHEKAEFLLFESSDGEKSPSMPLEWKRWWGRVLLVGKRRFFHPFQMWANICGSDKTLSPQRNILRHSINLQDEQISHPGRAYITYQCAETGVMGADKHHEHLLRCYIPSLRIIHPLPFGMSHSG